VRDIDDNALESRLVAIVDNLIDLHLLGEFCSPGTMVGRLVQARIQKECGKATFDLSTADEGRVRAELRTKLAGDLAAPDATIDSKRAARELAADLLSMSNMAQRKRASGLANTLPVVVATAPGAASESTVTNMTASLQPLLDRTPGGALSQGRVEKGLETLVNEYLLSLPKNGNVSGMDKLSPDEQLLLTGLLNFAEKVLFLANSERLLAETSEDDTVKRYVRVLQAVGGSMLSQIDERYRLNRFENYDRVAAAEVFGYARRVARGTLLIEINDRIPATHLEDAEQKAVVAQLQAAQPEFDKLLGTLSRPLQVRQQATLALRPLSAKLGAVVGETDAAKRKDAADGLQKFMQSHQREVDESTKLVKLDTQMAAFQGAAGCKTTQWDADACGAACDTFQKAIDATLAAVQSDTILLSKWVAALNATVLVTPEQDTKLETAYSLLAETLRLRHIDAVAAGEDEIARRTEAAFQLTEEYRGGKLYIRPAMAFLRDSYPAADLQDEGAIFWKNLLGEQVVRSIPGMGTQQSADARIQSAIDKAYWQSINQVRLSGLNRTTYAVTKDDVGNWYVKGYSSKPDEMLQAFKNVALFSLGGDVRQTLSVLPAAKDGKAAANVPASQKSVLQQQYDAERQAYERRIVDLLIDLKRMMHDAAAPQSLTQQARRGAAGKLKGDAQKDFDTGQPTGAAMITTFNACDVATGSIGPVAGKRKISDVVGNHDFEAPVEGYRPATALADLLASANAYGVEQIDSIGKAARKVDSTQAWPGNAQTELQAGVAEGVRAFVLRYSARWNEINKDFQNALTIIGRPVGTVSAK
jgi:hypothetical protein